GGSSVEEKATDQLVLKIKELTTLPIVLFPGNYQQITSHADAILFLSLISGRNPEYLINQQVKSVPYLQKSDLEVIPTGYILIDGGKETSVQKVSETKPILADNIEEITQTAIAGMYMGNKLIYLEAGSGALHPVNPSVIKSVIKNLTIPLIVGGGIRSRNELLEAYKNGADVVVIGTAFEENSNFLSKFMKNEHIY
ncbi:phosphoglycerol geranylgeranyltransferase, partial [Lutimonas sp.]|uniref:phosphoglycerol geranylgeranyltransferase n=1 Tax=Lutimonas sp. TaxID=1872403 RepID=UPI003C75A5BA